jgi:hypothetical protein
VQIRELECEVRKSEFILTKDSRLLEGGYSQNFLSQILKIFVTLTGILEPIKQKK